MKLEIPINYALYRLILCCLVLTYMLGGSILRANLTPYIFIISYLCLESLLLDRFKKGS